MIVETLYLARRDLKKFWKSKFAVLTTLIRPLAWLVLFGLAFNPLKLAGGSQATLSANLAGAPNYFSFLAAGMASIMVLQLSLQSMGSLVIDRYTGFLDKVMVAPIRRQTVLGSKIVSYAFRGVTQGIVLLFVGYGLGLRPSSGFGVIQVAGILVVLVILGVSLSGIFVSIGGMVKNYETAQALGTTLSLPVMFTSNVLYPTRTMPYWLEPVAKINPVTYSSEIIRSLLFTPGANFGTISYDMVTLVLLLGASLVIVYVASFIMFSRR